MKKTLSILLILLLNPLVFVFAQSFSPRVMEVDLMKEELSLVRSKLIRIHPEPFHFLSFEDFEEKISNLKNRLEPMPVEQWYVHLASLISSLQDGHTVLLFNQEDRRRYFDQGGKILPFLVQVKDNKRAVLQHHFTNDSTLSAAELLSVNGNLIGEVLQNMHQLTFGELEVFRNAQITNSFGRMYWLLYGHSDSVTLSVEQRNGKLASVTHNCLTVAQYDEFVKIDFPKMEQRKAHHMCLTYANNRPVALLKLNDFNTYKGYRDSIEHTFKTIQQYSIDTLIIDIRGNGGGEHFITETINYFLLDTAWVLVSKAKIKMSDEFYSVFPKTVRWLAKILPKKPSIKLAAAIMTNNTKISRVVKVFDPTTKEPSYEIYTRPKQHFSEKHRFKGKVFLLIDRNSYSMSGMFAAILKDYNRGVLVGEETGGLANPHGSNVRITLPHSKFTFTVSTSRAYRPSGFFDHHGVIPDIKIPYEQLRTAQNVETILQLLSKFN
ncbi:MAG: S41 family peptidase [Chitinophagales bacterium]